MTLALQILLVVILLWFAGWLIRAGWHMREHRAADRAPPEGAAE